MVVCFGRDDYVDMDTLFYLRARVAPLEDV